MPYSISALNETALLVSFESRIDEKINRQVIALQDAFAQNQFHGFVETVPAYSSLAVFYDVLTVRENYSGKATAFEFVRSFTEKLISELVMSPETGEREPFIIPVFYNGEDLETLADLHDLRVDDVIAIHSSKTYRVFMIGFLPGFAYLGILDERIATPRHAAPRTHVPAGSVGIAGFQTGIYPMNSPGGWQLIGQTPTMIFDSNKEQPCLLQAGDHVKFLSISQKEFDELNEYPHH